MSDEYIKIEMSKHEWIDLLIDLDAFEGAIGNRDLEGYGEGLEPGSYELQRQLSYRDVTL